MNVVEPSLGGKRSAGDPRVASWVEQIARLIQPKAQREFPLAIREALFATVIGRVSNILMVSVAFFVCGTTGYLRQGPVAYWGIAFLGFALVVIRAWFIIIYQRRIANGYPLSMHLGLVVFTVLAFMSCVCYGFIGFVAFTYADDTTLIIVAVLSNIGSAGAAAARNCGAPRLAKGMLLLSLLPLMAGSLWATDAGFRLLILLVPAMIAGLFALIDERCEQLIELFFIQRELSSLSKLDPLTQISNRRHFDDRLDAVATTSLETKEPFALLMIDVDYFKAFNDTYGHPVGDHCLRQIAETLLLNSRGADDLVARYGGEEFVVLLEKANETEAAQVAERLRLAVVSLAIPHANRDDGLAIVTISVGGATAGQEVLAVETLIKKADRALYIAKKAGRNAVVGFGR